MACAATGLVSVTMVTQGTTALALPAHVAAVAMACVIMAHAAVTTCGRPQTALTSAALTIATAMASVWLASASASLAGRVLHVRAVDAPMTAVVMVYATRASPLRWGISMELRPALSHPQMLADSGVSVNLASKVMTVAPLCVSTSALI